MRRYDSLTPANVDILVAQGLTKDFHNPKYEGLLLSWITATVRNTSGWEYSDTLLAIYPTLFLIIPP